MVVLLHSGLCLFVPASVDTNGLQVGSIVLGMTALELDFAAEPSGCEPVHYQNGNPCGGGGMDDNKPGMVTPFLKHSATASVALSVNDQCEADGL